MSAIMVSAAPPTQPMQLREVRDARWQVQAAVGGGRILDFPDEDMRLELFLPPWSNPPGKLSMHASFDTAVACRYGTLLTDGAAAMWCLLGGVPQSAVAASPQESELRLSIGLQRTPSSLTDILGPLALVGTTWTAANEGRRPSAVSGEQWLGEDAIEMMLRLSREDVTVYARASALPALWLQLLSSMSPVSPTTGPPPLAPVDETVTVSVPIEIAGGRLAADVIRNLAVGDVVRLATSFDVKGRGHLMIGDIELAVRWRSRTPTHVFEVLQIASFPTAGTSDTSSTDEGTPSPFQEFAGMTTYITEQAGNEREDHGMLSGENPSEPWLVDDGADGPFDSPADRPADNVGTVRPAFLDKLQVVVVAEIGTLTMTLGQLRAIKPGMLIKLGLRGDDEVVLRAADGPPLAYAELVDIGGHIGMQVTRIATS